MDDVKWGLDFCFAYLDDILVFSRSLEDHENITGLSSAVFKHTGS
jgi:hypothetical protein